MLLCEKGQSTVLIPRMFPTQIKEGVTHVLQQHKKGTGAEGSGIALLRNNFTPVQQILIIFFHMLVLTFQISYDKQSNLN